MRIAVLGLGSMGSGIASRLLQCGYQVAVWNRSPGKADHLIERGAREAKTIQDAVRDAEVAIAVLADDTAVENVCRGEHGVIAALPRETVFVNMSTVSPELNTRIAVALPGRFVDAPILGSPEATAGGQARLFVGGPDDVVDRLAPLWQDLSSGYVHTGPNGSATTLKILANLLLIGGLALLSEMIVVGQRAGIANQQLEHVFAENPMVAPGLRNRFHDVLEGDHQGWFAVRLATKDVRLALGVAEKAGVTLSIGPAVLQILEKAEAAGYGDLDVGAIVEGLRGTTQGTTNHA